MDRGRILVVTMVRNECDIIEAFVRHHAAIADRIWVLLHASSDTTAAILERLAGEGLPVTVERDDAPALAKEARFNALIDRALVADPAEYILPLDADEFVLPADRGALLRELAALPAGGALMVPWRTYLPHRDDDPGEPNPLRRLSHRRRSEPKPIAKAFVPRASFRRPEIALVDGQHALSHRDGAAIAHVEARALVLAHFPIRSPEQFVTKIVIGWLARRLSPDRIADHSAEWRRWYERLAPDFLIAPDALPAMAAEYYGVDATELVYDPVAPATPLAHGDLIALSPLGRVVALADSLVDRLGRADDALRDGGLDRAAVESMLAERAALRVEVRQAGRDITEVGHLRRRLARAQRRAIVAALIALAALAALAAVLLR